MSTRRPGIVMTFLLLILCPLLLTGRAAAQSRTGFDVLSTRHGLSDNYILCILQDRRGFLWFGTRDGLNRYDGNGVTIYKNNVNDSFSIADGSADCILEDSDGGLWVGTSAGGLNYYDRITERFIHYRYDPADPTSISGDRIISMCEDKGGDLWIVTDGAERGALVRMNRRTGRCVRFRHDPRNPAGLIGGRISCVALDAAGNIWVGSEDHGVCVYDRAAGGFITGPGPADDPMRSRDIEMLYRSGSDTGADRGLLYGVLDKRSVVKLRLEGKTIRAEHVTISPNGDPPSLLITSLYVDRKGRLLVGTVFDGLIVAGDSTGTGRSIHRPTDPYSIASNRIFSMFQDRAGNLWVGTDNGVGKLTRRGGTFRHYRYDPLDSGGISHQRVRCVIRDSQGRLWIGTGGGGINRLDPGARSFTHYTAARGREAVDLTVNTLYEDSRGTIWAGTNGGLKSLPAGGRRWIDFIHDTRDTTSLSVGGVWGILEDRSGVLWIALHKGGLSRLNADGRTFTRYMHDPADPGSLGNDVVHALHEDREGNLWIGTEGGLDMLDRDRRLFRHYRHDPGDRNSLGNDRVWFIHEATDGMLWLATSGGGLNRFDRRNGRFTKYTEGEGLASNMACGIVEDDLGDLWISTNNGVSRFVRSTGRFRNFDAGDGWPVHEFHFKACWRDRRGNILLGGNYGVIEFHPDDMRDSGSVPGVIITSFRVFGRESRSDTSIVMRKHIALMHDRNSFSIAFAALDMTNPSRNRFSYRLEGFDDDWKSTTGRDPVATYTNIPPGSYVFHVRASNSDGAWNREGVRLAVEVLPAYWQTEWFRGTILLGGVGALSALVLVRMRTIRREAELRGMLIESRLRALQGQMNPHFVFNSLNSILHFIAGHDTASASRYLTTFSRLMRATLESSKLDSISLAEEIDSLTQYLELESLRFDRMFSYRIDVDPSIDQSDTEIPPLLIQPYVENAVKHGLMYRGKGGELVVRFRRFGHTLICSVVDNGIGRKKAAELKSRFGASPPSRGMEMTMERIEALRLYHGLPFTVGVVDRIVAGEAAGTEVNIHVPLRGFKHIRERAA